MNLFSATLGKTGLPDSPFALSSFPKASQPTPTGTGGRNGGKALLAIYGNGSANKMPGSGGSVQPAYEFCFRYLAGFAEFFSPMDEDTLLSGNAQQGYC